MKHYMFECTVPFGYNEGERFIVQAGSYQEAKEIAVENFDEVEFLCVITEEEAEASGLDEY